MDFCRNLSVSGGLPAEYASEHNGTYSSSSLDDLFPIQNTEGDVNLEWLSAFVEDCLSSSGNSISMPAVPPTAIPTPTIPKPCEEKVEKISSSTLQLQELSIPGKARSKRKRSPTIKTTRTTFPHLQHLKNQPFHVTSYSDPPLLHQAYWLADSELIFPKKICKEEEQEEVKIEEEEEEEEEEQEMMMMMVMNEKDSNSNSSNNNNNVGSWGSSSNSSSCSSIETGHGGQPRRCTHCLSQRTPQWRAGPLGPKTLCNACGVRFKSGRLLPEYRPAKSPTFVSYKHSNSHKKVMEMRMSSVSSDHE